MSDVVTERRTAIAKQKLLKQIAEQRMRIEGYKLERMELEDRILKSRENQEASERALSEMQAQLKEVYGDG